MFGSRRRQPILGSGSGANFSEAHRNAVRNVRQIAGNSVPVVTVQSRDNGLGRVTVMCAYDPDGAYAHLSREDRGFAVQPSGRVVSPKPTRAGTLRSTARDAELMAAEYLRDIGFRDAYATSATSDGGIDVLGSGVAAQVKWQNALAGRPALQSFFGACHPNVAERILCFFTFNGYSAPAKEYAASASIALFTFDGSPKRWAPDNAYATHLLNALKKLH